MLTVANVLQALREWAPFDLAWDRDNIGLLVGSGAGTVRRILVCLDLTEEVAHEAAAESCDLIVAHHPVIFHPLRSIDLDTEQGRDLTREAMAKFNRFTPEEMKKLESLTALTLGKSGPPVYFVTDPM